MQSTGCLDKIVMQNRQLTPKCDLLMGNLDILCGLQIWLPQNTPLIPIGTFSWNLVQTSAYRLSSIFNIHVCG